MELNTDRMELLLRMYQFPHPRLRGDDTTVRMTEFYRNSRLIIFIHIRRVDIFRIKTMELP